MNPASDTATAPESGIIPLALRPKAAASALGISARKLWTLTNMKRIPHIRVGKSVLYPVSELQKWLAESAERLARFD